MKKSKDMYSVVEEITPARAEKVLLVNYNNRRKNTRKIATYVRMMRGGKWMLTHQGIAFDTRGYLVDGQNRMEAIKIAGVPVKMRVTYNLPHEAKNGVVLNVSGAIDRGQPRNVADELVMHHGVQAGYGTLVAAMAARVVNIATGYSGRIESPEAAAVLGIYGKDIEDVVAISGFTRSLRTSPVLGAFVIAYAAERESLPEFISAYFTGEGLKKGNPAFTLREYVVSNGNRHASNWGRIVLGNLVLTAAHKHVSGVPWSRARGTDEARGYFLAKQERRVKKLIELFPKIDHKDIKKQLSPEPLLAL